MKKLLPIVLSTIILLLFYLQISSPYPSQAQGCGGILGSNVATNWYRTNLEYIRNNAGCSGPIPIEVIITPAERDNPQLLLDLQKNLQELNFVPTWRPWGNGMPQGSELQAWINAASYLTIGQFQLFNEPNNCYFGCFSGSTPNPAADAAAALAFFEASQRGEISIPLALMPLSPRTPDGGPFLSEQTYWTQFNNACGGCVKNFDYIGLSIYPLTTPGTNPSENVNKFINDFNARVSFFASLGVNISTTGFIIAEAGLDPGSYSGNFEQRVRDTIAFAQALEAKITSDPSLFLNIDQITFFLMDEATGKQYLVYRQCDTAGNCQWVVEGFLIYNPNIPGGSQTLTCTPSNPGNPDSRPVPCDPCNQTDLLTSSCASTFTVHDGVSYLRGDVDFWCPDENSKPWLERTWEGLITIDPSQTTIPFVGKKGGEDEEKYLADYFEGTDKYYADYQDPTQIISHSGVFRKLAPKSYQDELKRQIVWRAINTAAGMLREGGIHDYLVTHNGESARLSGFVDHFPPYENEENYQEKYEAWKKSEGGKWYKLWAAVPMFSREDTPGWINPYLGSRPLDQFEILDPEAQIEKVPHVARLYEITQKIQDIVSPFIPGTAQTQSKTASLFASTARENVLGGQVLQAQYGEPSFSAYGYCTRTDGSYTVNLTVNFTLPSKHSCRDINVEIKSPTYWQHTCPNERACGGLVVTPFTVPGQPGGGINVTYAVKAHGVNGPAGSPWTPNVEMNDSFAIQFTEDSCIIAGGPMPEPPGCGLRAPMPVNACEKEAITDSNPNDDLCCSPINIALSATDQFENTDYIPCGVEIKCNPVTGICRDACEQTRSHAVNRKVGITLLHPYLAEIWEQTAEAVTGFFNIFRPENVPEFASTDAASDILYGYQPGSVSPSSGQFYFPFLGGIQLAKEWVLQTLNPSGDGGGRPPGPAAPTEPPTLNYTIDFRNPNIGISDETKNYIIQLVKIYWPNTKIESQWDYVYNQAVSHGWNPAFVIALWIEESGASALDAHDLGCLGGERNNLSSQLDCLFSRPYANESFEEFMCMYSEGAHAPCTFVINPNFPGNLKVWYDRLTQ